MNNAHGWNLVHTYAELSPLLYSHATPTPVAAPSLVVLNARLASQLGLVREQCTDDYAARVFSGNESIEGAKPIAQAYAGHQYGHFTMLGDGRAILLGEHRTPEGRLFDIQLKGAGRTQYSRNGDGRAALGPMLREYLISEAMHALGIPTTRSLAVVKTGEEVFREEPQQGSVLTRVASSHLRVGTFEYVASLGDTELLRQLTDYAIKRHFPELSTHSARYEQFLIKVITYQASLIAQWMLVGFVHGVMNTDNMSICGETIDYGPCAWMDAYDPATVFSSIDKRGRYAFGQQPSIACWNLANLAGTLVPLLSDDPREGERIAQEALAKFPDTYELCWLEGMRKKIGLGGAEEGDADLVSDFLELLYKEKADYTTSFHTLASDIPFEDHPAPFDEWLGRWNNRRKRDSYSRRESDACMRATNPVIIPRNHHVEAALLAAVKGDMKRFTTLLSIVQKPFVESEENKEYRTPPSAPDPHYRTYCGT